ncbi:uncharacterized protein EKO05_0005368 [Ascochyta rabiei]|uniref:uncharacterized protein n=1 Tax=Didymella rabiei TaxID=5454 RepID=UPI0022004154|nr:uncharacterized protein EKO05_0005368 [Ascochyta rabiei]UPX14897.1 hypothetical protein EKO05_0005368 [Ascochyta rabiei]
MEADDIPGPRPSKAVSHACLQCRKVKMKCHKTAQDTRCVRCTRKSLQCDFLGHRRGRKRGFKLQNHSSRGQENAATTSANGEAVTKPSETSNLLAQHVEHDIAVAGDADALTDARGARRPTSRPRTRPQSTRRSGQEFWTQNDGFRPSDILSRQATRGDFSLQNVLSTEHEHAAEQRIQGISDDDLIDKGLVNFHVATSLFDGFMKHLNPFISQLDPSLHTFRYVRETSSFLLAAVLAVAAKLLHPSLHKSLLSHAEGLFLESFRCGSKSPETVQAILILTYWKDPHDNRAWLSVGYAIRMAIELGWQHLGNDGMRAPENTSDRQAMHFRNIERTWLVLFVYDRSISLQTGKPWMIERSSYLESVSKWHLHALEVANDRLLCAFVSLRLITSTHFEMVTTQYAQNQRHEPSQYRSLLRLLDRQIIDWQKRWTETVSDQGEDCHAFLIPFYGSYARLLLFTFSLRASVRLRDIVTSVDTEAIWNSCSSALDMLKLVSEPSASQLVYFAQDSVHVMIAYATVFLIKLLLSAPAYIRIEMELPALDSIRNTAEIFATLRAPAGTSCSLQAAFLRNALIEYEAIKARRTSRSHIPTAPAATAAPVDLAAPRYSPTYAQDMQRPDATSACDDRGTIDFASEEASAFDMGFINDEAWVHMFANAGFNIGQGVFLLPS